MAGLNAPDCRPSWHIILDWFSWFLHFWRKIHLNLRTYSFALKQGWHVTGWVRGVAADPTHIQCNRVVQHPVQPSSATFNATKQCNTQWKPHDSLRQLAPLGIVHLSSSLSLQLSLQPPVLSFLPSLIDTRFCRISTLAQLKIQFIVGNNQRSRSEQENQFATINSVL